MTDKNTPWILDRFGPRGAKLAIVLSGLLYFILIVGGGALIVVDGWQSDRTLRAVTIGGLALIALLIWVRIVLANWRAINAQSENPDIPRLTGGNEDTGIWGVGGPGMREPGSTGIARTLRGPRADEEE
jgi:hypothetical protein